MVNDPLYQLKQQINLLYKLAKATDANRANANAGDVGYSFKAGAFRYNAASYTPYINEIVDDVKRLEATRDENTARWLLEQITNKVTLFVRVIKRDPYATKLNRDK